MQKRKISPSRTATPVTAALLGALLLASPASATTLSGTVTFDGDAAFVSPIVGIALDDLTVFSGPGIEATGNGEHCDIVTNDSAAVDAGGNYSGVAVGIELSHGGMVVPDGNCKVQLRVGGNDGASVSAHGTVTVEVTAAQITGNAMVTASTIPVRQSKTQAGIDVDCQKWVKKQIKLRGKCNAALWKYGAVDGALKCKTADVEPPACDPVDYAEAVLALSFGDMDQQVDPPSASAIDLDILNDQAKCQRYIGKAAVNFIVKRNKEVEKNCVEALADTEACRAQAGTDSNTKLSVIDNCVTAQGTDVMSTLAIADVDEPCRAQCIVASTLDRKCLKDCFKLELSTLSDGLIGDIPECGNGVIQQGEACDDGNVVSGDCCSSTCTIEPAGSQMCGVGACQVTVAQCSGATPVTCTPGTPGTEMSPAECSDTIDNDCDGLTDAADGDCPP